MQREGPRRAQRSEHGGSRRVVARRGSSPIPHTPRGGRFATRGPFAAGAPGNRPPSLPPVSGKSGRGLYVPLEMRWGLDARRVACAAGRAVVVSALAAASIAGAQESAAPGAPTQPSAAPPGPSGAPSQGSGPSGAPTQPSAAPPAIPVPEVSDPMLAPPPPAPKELRSWEEALGLIRTRAPGYLAGTQGILRAQAESRIVLAGVLPTVTGQAGYTHQFLTETLSIPGASIVTPPSNVWSAGGTLSWSAVNPRALYAVGTARRAEDETKVAFQDSRRQLAQDVVNAMLQTIATARLAELNRVGLRAALERLALARARLTFAQGTPLDVDRGEQDVERARALLISGDEMLRQAREDFGRLVGSTVPLGAPINLDLEAFERAVARTCRLNDEIERRPDVVLARQRFEIARRGIKDADLMYSPYLDVFASANHASAVTFGPKTTVLVAGVVTVPIFEGGARYGARRDAVAAAEQARQDLVAARVNAVISKARSERLVGVTESARDVARATRDLAFRIDQRTRAGYSGGFGTSLDLVTSAQNQRQAEIDLVLQEFRVGEARANAVLASAECSY